MLFLILRAMTHFLYEKKHFSIKRPLSKFSLTRHNPDCKHKWQASVCTGPRQGRLAVIPDQGEGIVRLMAIGDRIRAAASTPRDDKQWRYGLRYAIMLDIEAFKERESFRNPLSHEQLDAIGANDLLAYKFSQSSEIMDLIAPIESQDPAWIAAMANEFANYLAARDKEPNCEAPNLLKGKVFVTELGI